jgi:predicted dehydrogenase
VNTVRFAVIGTNWITGALIDAGRTVDGFDVVAVCSRSAQTGRAFADRYGITRVHTSVADLGGDPDVDAVYIASPNSLHAEQSSELLRAGKHVLTEKPMGANAREVEAMAGAALAADRVLMEAYTSPWEPNVEAIRDALPDLGTLRRAVLAKDQYSSRYDRLKAGELPNAFNPEFAAGSLMDLGIYPVALSLLLFGEPASVHATGHVLPSGVDGQGTILLGYDGFEVACLHSKIAPGGVGSAITGEAGVLHFDDCSVPTAVRLDLRDGRSRELTREQSPHHMRYEVQHFLECVHAGTQSPIWPVANSLAVARILDHARAQVGVRFPGDT